MPFYCHAFVARFPALYRTPAILGPAFAATAAPI
jgi:hypothetical protein